MDRLSDDVCQLRRTRWVLPLARGRAADQASRAAPPAPAIGHLPARTAGATARRRRTLIACPTTGRAAARQDRAAAWAQRTASTDVRPAARIIGNSRHLPHLAVL